MYRYNIKYEAPARSLASLKNLSEPGSIHPPLLHFPIDHIIPDELHLLLRITDRLIENLLYAAVIHDSPRQALQGEMAKNVVKEIESCGMNFTARKNARYEFTSLTGTDRKKLLKELQTKILRCQPAEFASKVKLLWEVCSYSYVLLLYYIAS